MFVRGARGSGSIAFVRRPLAAGTDGGKGVCGVWCVCVCVWGGGGGRWQGAVCYGSGAG